MRAISWIISNAIALAVAAWLFEGVRFDGPTSGQGEVTEKLLPLLIVSVILGLVSLFVAPVVKILSLPFIIVTIGLFLLVINALMLLLTGWIAGKAGVGFYIDGFWTALIASIVITIVTGAVKLVVEGDQSRDK